MSKRGAIARSRSSCWACVAAIVLQSAPALGGESPGEPMPRAADAVKAPEQVIRQTVDAVFAILRDATLAKDSKKRMQALREVVDPAFDWPAMARSSLGVHWRKLDDTQRTEFVEVFKELLAQQYMDDIDRFQGTEQVSVTGSEKSADLVVVKTLLLTSSREQVPMNYTLHQSAGAWRVEDLSIEGVSLVNHYRKTFARFLVNRTFAELLEQLKRKLSAS